MRTTEQTTYPILYSFRRCPYAMRARLAILYSVQSVELREVVLKHKPESLLAVSPKGTVPVLITSIGEKYKHDVIEESLDIMLWALKKNDPVNILPREQTQLDEMLELIKENDGDFKHFLDRYKYADRYLEHSEQFYRTQGELFLAKLEQRLARTQYLFGDAITLADIAIFPFIRQFAHVDLNWFEHSEYLKLINWLNKFKESNEFKAVMMKYPQWDNEDEPVFFGNATL